jgi:hypothetical protein
MAVEQVDEAVIEFGDEDGDAQAVRGNREAPVHGKFGGDGIEVLGEGSERKIEFGEIPFDAGEVVMVLGGLVLLEVENITAVAVDEFGNGGVEAFAVGTLDE